MVGYTQVEKTINFQMRGLYYRVDLKRLENNNSIERFENFLKEKQHCIEIDSIQIIDKPLNAKLDYHANLIEKVLNKNKEKLLQNCYNGFCKFFGTEIKSNSYFINKCNLSMGNLIYFHYFMTLLLGEVYDSESLFLKYKKDYNFIKHEQIMALTLELMEKETLFLSSFIKKSYFKQLRDNGFAYLNLPLNVTNEIIETIIMFLINDCNDDSDYTSFNYMYNYHIQKYNNNICSININENKIYSKHFA